jgi:hypothetical protein
LIIEGLEDERAVLVVKMHHALADGVSFAETIANFFDISPDVRPPAARTDTLRRRTDGDHVAWLVATRDRPTAGAILT